MGNWSSNFIDVDVFFEEIIYPKRNPFAFLVVVVGGVALKENKYVNMRIQFFSADVGSLGVRFLSILIKNNFFKFHYF